MKINKFLLIGLLIGLTTVTLNTCCKDKPPQPPPPEEEEHLIYVAAAFGGLVKVFSIEQEMFVDSFTVDSVAGDETMFLHVLDDDSLLAASAKYKTYIYDTRKKEMVGSFPAGRVTWSPDSRYYFDGNDEAGRSELRTYPYHQLLYYDYYSAYFPTFSNDSRYLTYSRAIYELALYDIVEDTVIIEDSTHNGDTAIYFYSRYNSNYDRIFLGGNTIYSYFAGVSDKGGDTIRALKYCPQQCMFFVEISPLDDRNYFFPRIGTFWGGIPEYRIYVYDAETEDSLGAISFEGIFEPGEFVITYDGKYLAVIPFQEFSDDRIHQFCVVDSDALTVLGVYEFGEPIISVTTKQKDY